MSEQTVVSDKPQEQIVAETKERLNDLVGRGIREFSSIDSYVGYIIQFIDGETDVVTLPEVSREQWLLNLRKEVQTMVDPQKAPILDKRIGWGENNDPKAPLNTLRQATVLKDVFLEHNLDEASGKYSIRLIRDVDR